MRQHSGSSRGGRLQRSHCTACRAAGAAHCSCRVLLAVYLLRSPTLTTLRACAPDIPTLPSVLPSFPCFLPSFIYLCLSYLPTFLHSCVSVFVAIVYHTVSCKFIARCSPLEVMRPCCPFEPCTPTFSPALPWTHCTGRVEQILGDTPGTVLYTSPTLAAPGESFFFRVPLLGCTEITLRAALVDDTVDPYVRPVWLPCLRGPLLHPHGFSPPTRSRW